eukprot:scaffold3450_cov114-Cylindrotheca_fusiformis.AAC.36
MTKQENDPNKTNSLLRTATDARLGASKTALTAIKSNSRPPVQKVNLQSSNMSRISELSNPVNNHMRPAMVKQVGRATDVEIASNIIDGSTKSEASAKPINKAFSGPNFKSKISFGMGAALRVTPQPARFPTKLMKISNAPQKSIDIHKGIAFSAPSPMSLDRVQVQLGQERVLPESKEFKEQQERARKEKERATKEAQYQKAKDKVKRQLQSEVEKEIGEGFEAQLEDFDPATSVGNEKYLVQQIIGKLKPNMDSPSQVAEARFLARRAIHASKKANPIASASGRVSVPDGSQGQFPVSEILMGENGQKMDDGSISTIGNPQIRASHVVRHHVDNTNALIDQIDSVTAAEDATEAAMEEAMKSGCEVSNDKMTGSMATPVNCSMGADILGTFMGHPRASAVPSRGETECGEVIDADALFTDRHLESRLYRIVEGSEMGAESPRSECPVQNREGGEVVDLTKDLGRALSSVAKVSKGRDQGQDEVLNRDFETDRYAVEGDEKLNTDDFPQSTGGRKRIQNGKHDDDQEENAAEPTTDERECQLRGLSKTQSTDDDPMPGFICGAVPLYFMCSTRKNKAVKDEVPVVPKIAAASTQPLELKTEETDREVEPTMISQVNLPLMAKPEKTERNGKRDKAMLDKDDAYWDTLSTIASTRGLDYEKFAPAPRVPNAGPIPIEITTNLESEENHTATSSKEGKPPQPIKVLQPIMDSGQPTKVLEQIINSGEGDQSLSYSHATTDCEKKGESQFARQFQADTKGPQRDASNLVYPLSFQHNGSPKQSKRHEQDALEDNSELLLAITRSGSSEVPITMGKPPIDTFHKTTQERSVTWGFEEIFEAQDSEVNSAKESRFSSDYKEEQQLLSRTLQLSKDLLASLAQEEADTGGTLSLNTDESSQTRSSLTSQRILGNGRGNDRALDESSLAYPIDVEKLFQDSTPFQSNLNDTSSHLFEHTVYGNAEAVSGSTSNRTPEILSKLDILRSQRAAALARFQNCRPAPAIENTSLRPELFEGKNRKLCKGSNATMLMQQQQDGSHNIICLDGRDEMGPDIGESAGTTPSKKARELRRQLDEALHASREIRRSQERLGNDLQTFKSRFYQKNGELEHRAIRAMGISSTVY